MDIKPRPFDLSVKGVLRLGTPSLPGRRQTIGFGALLERVHEQLPIASGTTLRIDFHLGHRQRPGVGVECKMPTNNADVQRALGQLDQYRERYGANLVLFVIGDYLDRAPETLFIDAILPKGITVLQIKQPVISPIVSLCE